jgi:hypothetical protein
MDREVNGLKLDDFEIVKTRGDGSCGIHTILHGLRLYYSVEEIRQILNQYLNYDMGDIILLSTNPVTYCIENTNAVRDALFMFYKNKRIKLLGLTQKHIENITKPTEFLKDEDLFAIAKMFDVCVILNIEYGNKRDWRILNPFTNGTNSAAYQGYNKDRNPVDIVNCARSIYINHVDLIHWELLKPVGAQYVDNILVTNRASVRPCTTNMSSRKSTPMYSPSRSSSMSKRTVTPYKSRSSSMSKRTVTPSKSRSSSMSKRTVTPFKSGSSSMSKRTVTPFKSRSSSMSNRTESTMYSPNSNFTVTPSKSISSPMSYSTLTPSKSISSPMSYSTLTPYKSMSSSMSKRTVTPSKSRSSSMSKRTVTPSKSISSIFSNKVSNTLSSIFSNKTSSKSKTRKNI